MAVLSWRGLIAPNFSVPSSGETMRQTPKSFRGARTCSMSSITMPSLVGLGFHPPPRRPKTLSFLSVCLFVCLFVTLLNVRVCAPEYKTILIPLVRGRFVVVHPCSTFSDCRQLSTPLNAELQKTAKVGFFDTRGRQNKPIETNFGT